MNHVFEEILAWVPLNDLIIVWTIANSSQPSKLINLPCKAPSRNAMKRRSIAGDKVLLKSSQGEIFEVEPEVACMSTLVRTVGGKSGNFDVPMSRPGVLLSSHGLRENTEADVKLPSR